MREFREGGDWSNRGLKQESLSNTKKEGGRSRGGGGGKTSESRAIPNAVNRGNK